MAETAGGLGRAELLQMTDGRSDEEIGREVASMGTDTVLAKVFQGLERAFLADRAAGQTAVVQWDLSTADGPRSWQVSVEHGSISAGAGSEATPRVTLALGLADFLRFLAGRLDGMQAFMSGKLRVSGDLMLAQAMQSWFDRSSPAGGP
ncbi:MAG: SCP2 sterol-binding domain-containing protein [Acidimicrobiales bacterium]